MQDLLEVLEKHLIAICLGIFGGACRDLSSTDFAFRKFLVGMGLTAFVAVMMSLLVADFGCPFTVKGFLIGMSGYASRSVLDVLNRILMEHLKRLGGGGGGGDSGKKSGGEDA